MNNSFNIGSFNADNAAVNMGGTIEGDQIGTQNYYINDPRTKAAISNLETVLQNLRQQAPQADDEQLLQKLVRGFAIMPQQKPQNWQRWRDVLSIIFAGGIETAKIMLPPIGIPIEVVKQLYGIFERNSADSTVRNQISGR